MGRHGASRRTLAAAGVLTGLGAASATMRSPPPPPHTNHRTGASRRPAIAETVRTLQDHWPRVSAYAPVLRSDPASR
ncbi:hypothetical protein GCM10010368_23880 [Streptomyces roseiscleroticus]|uniref:Uncharacterized protein n=1 Tax=Streptomyces roseiscleroticus TaxID=1972 RepID=A0ABN3EEX7_9ACTN